MEKSLQDIIKSIDSEGYQIDKRPNALNIVGIRNSKATDQNTFDDLLAYFYWDDKGKLQGKVAPATTDPSTYFLQSPLNSAGTAILKSGQYKNAYKIGTHKGKYEALVQTGAPVTTIRDNDRNAYINYFAITTSGYYGINIHRASRGKNNAAYIDKDSAGCQVFRDEDDFSEMMSLARIHKNKYGNNFTYTLIDDRDFIKNANTMGLGILLVVVAYYIYKKTK